MDEGKRRKWTLDPGAGGYDSINTDKYYDNIVTAAEAQPLNLMLSSSEQEWSLWGHL